MITKQEAEIVYANLIHLRRNEVLKKDPTHLGQVEIHHILPISCGGKDEPENKIALYAKEHFMAHVYLWIIHHDDEFHEKCLYALHMMNYGSLKVKYISKSEEIPDGHALGMPRILDETRDKIRKTLRSYTTDNPEYRRKQYEYLYPLYALYHEAGFLAMKSEFSYPYS